MLETVKKEVYKTSDGKEFIYKQDAEQHQEYLNKPKVYVVINRVSSSILMTTLNYNKALTMKNNHKGIGISVDTYVLE